MAMIFILLGALCFVIMLFYCVKLVCQLVAAFFWLIFVFPTRVARSMLPKKAVASEYVLVRRQDLRV